MEWNNQTKWTGRAEQSRASSIGQKEITRTSRIIGKREMQSTVGVTSIESNELLIGGRGSIDILRRQTAGRRRLQSGARGLRHGHVGERGVRVIVFGSVRCGELRFAATGV